MENPNWDLVCVSHLWWDWVWQRPQHVLTRFARRQPVLWIEEPRLAVGPPGEAFEVVEKWPNLWVASLLYRSDAETFTRRLEAHVQEFGPAGFDPASSVQHASLLFQGAPLRRLEQEVVGYVPTWRRGRRLVLWLYTPMALGFVDLLRPDLVVYDVMDDLAAFDFPPPGLLDLQDALLARADLVFAGGPSIRNRVLARRPDTYLFASGVEQQHFARALDPSLAQPAEAAGWQRPIIGYFGVIDERLDLPLLDRVAALRPDWTWVLVGPVTKVAPEVLPRHPNLHYVGKRDYNDLPAYLKTFDVAMMPFALNNATRSISPTKTLEYMAAHKPIVSTPVRDVVDLYGSIVSIAEGPEALVAAVEAILAQDEGSRARRVEHEKAVLDRSSWDAIADAMYSLVEQHPGRSIR